MIGWFSSIVDIGYVITISSWDVWTPPDYDFAPIVV